MPLLIALDVRVETRLIDGQLVPLQPLDFLPVDVGADDVVPRFSETGAHDKSDVPGSNDADVHAGSRTGASAPLGEASVTTRALVGTRFRVTLRLSTMRTALSMII